MKQFSSNKLKLHKLLELSFYFIIVLVVIFLLISRVDDKNEISVITKRMNELERDIAFCDEENGLVNSLLGEKINLPYNTVFLYNDSEFKEQKILFLIDDQNCQPCYSSLISNFYKAKDSLQYFNKSTFFVLIQSKNINYAKSIARKLYKGLNIIVDTTMQFAEKNNISSTNSAVLLLDKNNICFYAKLFNLKNMDDISTNIEIINRLSLN
ncbi:MAG: hypothetical protein RDU14_17840 [Melioribacteraceae bacterium]|nr:hypothetical protein [Melioribacteraceae bacterium]